MADWPRSLLPVGHLDTLALEGVRERGGGGNALRAGAYAMGFVPLPLQVLDFYGKVRLVRSELDGRLYTFDPRSDSRAELALGAGMQAHFRRIGARLEYERFNIPQTTHAYGYSIAVTYDLR